MDEWKKGVYFIHTELFDIIYIYRHVSFIFEYFGNTFHIYAWCIQDKGFTIKLRKKKKPFLAIKFN